MSITNKELINNIDLSNILHVTDLPDGVTEQDLYYFFKDFKIEQIKLAR